MSIKPMCNLFGGFMNVLNFKAVLAQSDNRFIRYPAEVIVTNWEISTEGEVIWAVVRVIKNGIPGPEVMASNPTLTNIGNKKD